MDVKVLGYGCRNCVATADLIDAKAREMDVPVTIEKVTDMAAIAGYGVMRTPGVVIDGKVVHAGGVPQPAAVETWLKAAKAAAH
jgi:predicted thioredoxin/glutaredoxin